MRRLMTSVAGLVLVAVTSLGLAGCHPPTPPWQVCNDTKPSSNWTVSFAQNMQGGIYDSQNHGWVSCVAVYGTSEACWLYEHNAHAVWWYSCGA